MKFGKTGHEVEVNIRSREALFRAITDRIGQNDGFALATLNLDHLTKLPADPAFLEAYRAQDFVVADGRPLVWLSQIAGNPVELMPGSDLIFPLCALCAAQGKSVALIGSSDHALDGAAKALIAQFPELRVVFSRSPPYGFDPDSPEAVDILKELAESGAALCFVALGAPKQEVFAARGRAVAPTVGFASIGAGLDFLSGHQIRAPKLMRMLALEWLWRILQSPRRMLPRYAKCFAILPGLIIMAFRQR